MNGSDGVQSQLAGQDDPFETLLFEESDVRGSTVVHLRAGVDGERQVHAEQGHILHDEGVNSYSFQVVGHGLNLWQFVVVENRVERYIDPGTDGVGMLTQTFNVGKGIGGFRAGAECTCANVDGIGTAVDSFNAGVGIAGR